jgi:hypothetical protein
MTPPTPEQLIAEARRFVDEVSALNYGHLPEMVLVSSIADALTAALQERDEAQANAALWPTLYKQLEAERDGYQRGCQEWNEKFETWRAEVTKAHELERDAALQRIQALEQERDRR